MDWSRLDAALARGGHPGGSRSTARLLEALTSVLQPGDLVLSSKGHDAAAFLAWRGGDPTTYRRVNGWPGHPERGVHGALVSTGSLGMGLSKAVGLAAADRTRRVFVVVGDGEQQEGQVWEAAQHAARLGLENLVVLLDANGAQSDLAPMPVPQSRWPDGLWRAACWSVLPVTDARIPVPLVIPPGAPLALLCHSRKEAPHAAGDLRPLPDLIARYGRALEVACATDDRIVLVHADLCRDHGLTALPGVQSCGIAEQHLVSYAVGLAAAGKHPVVHTFARFYLRAAEQVYDALAEPGLAIRFVAALAGPLPVGPGPSHEIDAATERALFRCRTYTPRTRDAVDAAVVSMLRQPRSTYLRLLAQPDLEDA